jgi:crossover junction endodeoxyribonuclease RusA
MPYVVLPWPPRELSPNHRHAHWSQLARAKKRYRAACALISRAQGAGRVEWPEMAVSLTFVPPDKRRRDWDNLVASIKAGLDGLADVLGVDDSRWTVTSRIAHGETKRGGEVRVEVREVQC